MKIIKKTLLALILFNLTISFVYAKKNADQIVIGKQVFTSSGRISQMGNFTLGTSFGILTSGIGNMGNYSMISGFWSGDLISFNQSCCNLSGDANNDGIIGISDLTYFVDYMFNSGSAPICFEEFDNDGSCILGISDLTWFIDYMFNEGPLPVDCHTCE